jgi:hypothetical protein
VDLPDARQEVSSGTELNEGRVEVEMDYVGLNFKVDVHRPKKILHSLLLEAQQRSRPEPQNASRRHGPLR